jgi:hypothetical protein
MQIGVKNIKNVLVTSIIINDYDVKKKNSKKTHIRKKKKKKKNPSMLHKNNMPLIFHSNTNLRRKIPKFDTNCVCSCCGLIKVLLGRNTQEPIRIAREGGRKKKLNCNKVLFSSPY